MCYFDGNPECEEWALLGGECPARGVKVTGYFTAPARHCAILAGQYAVTGNSNNEDKHGTCTFANGTSCDVWQLWNGTCTPRE